MLLLSVLSKDTLRCSMNKWYGGGTLLRLDYCQQVKFCLSFPVLTSLFSGHLGLQVLGGDIELRLLVHGWPRFTFTTATVTAATQATAEITTCGQAAEDKQGLWDENGRQRDVNN